MPGKVRDDLDRSRLVLHDDRRPKRRAERRVRSACVRVAHEEALAQEATDAGSVSVARGAKLSDRRDTLVLLLLALVQL